MPLPTFLEEEKAFARGYRTVCGIDEAGRGPLAGPVVAAAVILCPGKIPEGLNDSKRLSPAKREALFEALFQNADIGIGICDVLEIGEKNILGATFSAMIKAFKNLSIPADYALIDGPKMPHLPCPSQALIKGDSLSLSIAAASIVAKVTRDRMMSDLDQEFPQYGFARHKGYGTKDHLAALKVWGPTPHHRPTFAPVSSFFKKTPRI